MDPRKKWVLAREENMKQISMQKFVRLKKKLRSVTHHNNDLKYKNKEMSLKVQQLKEALRIAEYKITELNAQIVQTSASKNSLEVRFFRLISKINGALAEVASTGADRLSISNLNNTSCTTPAPLAPPLPLTESNEGPSTSTRIDPPLRRLVSGLSPILEQPSLLNGEIIRRSRSQLGQIISPVAESDISSLRGEVQVESGSEDNVEIIDPAPMSIREVKSSLLDVFKQEDKEKLSSGLIDAYNDECLEQKVFNNQNQVTEEEAVQGPSCTPTDFYNNDTELVVSKTERQLLSESPVSPKLLIRRRKALSPRPFQSLFNGEVESKQEVSILENSHFLSCEISATQNEVSKSIGTPATNASVKNKRTPTNNYVSESSLDISDESKITSTPSTSRILKIKEIGHSKTPSPQSRPQVNLELNRPVTRKRRKNEVNYNEHPPELEGAAESTQEIPVTEKSKFVSPETSASANDINKNHDSSPVETNATHLFSKNYRNRTQKKYSLTGSNSLDISERTKLTSTPTPSCSKAQNTPYVIPDSRSQSSYSQPSSQPSSSQSNSPTIGRRRKAVKSYKEPTLNAKLRR